MITYRRRTLPAPLRAVAWRQPPDPSTGRSRLVVVVDSSLDTAEARTAALLAIRKLPRQQPPRQQIKSASACVAMLAALMAATLGARMSVPLPDVPHPRRGRVVSVETPVTTPISAPAGALAA